MNIWTSPSTGLGLWPKAVLKRRSLPAVLGDYCMCKGWRVCLLLNPMVIFSLPRRSRSMKGRSIGVEWVKATDTPRLWFRGSRRWMARLRTLWVAASWTNQWKSPLGGGCARKKIRYHDKTTRFKFIVFRWFLGSFRNFDHSGNLNRLGQWGDMQQAAQNMQCKKKRKKMQTMEIVFEFPFGALGSLCTSPLKRKFFHLPPGECFHFAIFSVM